MPIRKHFPTFWWFQDDLIGGMARPGYNRNDWDELDYVESLLLAWIGKLTGTTGTHASLCDHVAWYREVVRIFDGMPEAELDSRLEKLLEPAQLLDELARLNDKSHVLAEFDWRADEHDGGSLEVVFDEERTRAEVALLQEHGFDAIVSLIEQPPDPIVVESGLAVHHFAVDDLTPPTREQVEAFALVLDDAIANERRIAVHCLAGIGRTSTMLMAGHIVRGHSLEHVVSKVKERNPRYGFAGRQWEFLQQLASETA